MGPGLSQLNPLSTWLTTCHLHLPRMLPTAIVTHTHTPGGPAVPVLVSLHISASTKPFS